MSVFSPKVFGLMFMLGSFGMQQFPSTSFKKCLVSTKIEGDPKRDLAINRTLHQGKFFWSLQDVEGEWKVSEISASSLT